MSTKRILSIVLIVILIIMLIPISIQENNGNKEYKAIIYKYTKINRLVDTHTNGNIIINSYEKGWQITLFGIPIYEKINNVEGMMNPNPQIFYADEIIKVTINNFSQYQNYFEYTDKDTIDKLYNIFSHLELSSSNKPTSNNANELYEITFYNSEYMLVESDNDIFKAIFKVYRKNNKYYIANINNDIYEISKENFNIISSYAK